MGFTNDVLLVLLISIFTSANNVDLTTNTNFLLLLLLILSVSSQQQSCSGINSCGVGGVATTCPGSRII